jgi:hypothetical protein
MSVVRARLRGPMSSLTQKTEKIRARKVTRQGKRRKRLESVRSTPVFPVHPEGYDPKAPDARSQDQK